MLPICRRQLEPEITACALLRYQACFAAHLLGALAHDRVIRSPANIHLFGALAFAMPGMVATRVRNKPNQYGEGSPASQMGSPPQPWRGVQRSKFNVGGCSLTRSS